MYFVIHRHKDTTANQFVASNPMTAFNEYQEAETFARQQAVKSPEKIYFVLGLSATVKMPSMLPEVLMNTEN